MCSSESVVFVTVPAHTVTKTVTVPLEKVVGAAGTETAPAVSQVPILKDITATLTSYVTFTELRTIVPVIPTPSASGQASKLTGSNQDSAYVNANQGPYYFSEHDGTLVWLDGKTPPAGGSYRTSTAFVTVQPVPTDFAVSAEENALSTAEGTTVSTSYSTISLYSVSTIYQTKVVTSTIPAPAAPVKGFVKLGSSGWNTSFTSTLKEDENKIASSTAQPILGQTGATENCDTHSETSTTYPAPTSSASVTKQLEARQLGALVVQTIDGVLVSWTNTFDGPVPTPEPLISWINIFTGPIARATLSPTTAVEVPIEENVLASGKSGMASRSSSELTFAEAAASQNLPSYPWDLTPPATRTTNYAPSRIASSGLSYDAVVAPGRS